MKLEEHVSWETPEPDRSYAIEQIMRIEFANENSKWTGIYYTLSGGNEFQ